MSNFPRSTRPRSLWETAGFFLLSTTLCLVLFWPAATGQKLFVPLDIAPNLFSKFKYVDPAATGVPANHYVIDLILGDLPRNVLVYSAWKHGEMAWWDPYTEGGRPLMAEANAVNASDPWKVVLFHLLPFEAAYNWARIVPFIVSGLTAFALLRYFGLSLSAAAWGGLLYQFAGCNVVMFSGPSIQASFAYYPLLWLLWDRGMAERSLRWFAWSAPVAALVFLSGNLQSHSYVFLFALAFGIGYGWRCLRSWGVLAVGLGLSLLVGLCLVAPFLFGQVELFFLSARKLSRAYSPAAMLSGLGSLTALFPWALGTFRTVDASKFFGQYALGFWIYIGSAALLMAGLGVGARTEANGQDRERRRTALVLVATYFVICSTPLLAVLYTRTAWLAVLGLVVLFARGWVRLAGLSTPLPRLGWGVVGLAVGVAVVLHLGGTVLYPRWQSRIEAIVLQKQRAHVTLDEATALRQFQVGNFSNEVTFKNRETLVAALSLVALGAYLLRPPAARRVGLHLLLVLSTLPLLWFTLRYIPMQSVALWENLRAGGPEQRRVVEAARAASLRLRETVAGPHEMVFPGALAQVFQVHSLQGYSSLQLQHAGWLTDAAGQKNAALHDFEYRSLARGNAQGDLVRRAEGPPARFHWAGSVQRSVEIVEETLNTITLAIGPGPAAELIRTDTYYPGWRVWSESGEISFTVEPPSFMRILVPPTVSKLRLAYEPRGLRISTGVAGGAGVGLVGLLIASHRRRQRTYPPPDRTPV